MGLFHKSPVVMEYILTCGIHQTISLPFIYASFFLDFVVILAFWKSILIFVVSWPQCNLHYNSTFISCQQMAVPPQLYLILEAKLCWPCLVGGPLETTGL